MDAPPQNVQRPLSGKPTIVKLLNGWDNSGKNKGDLSNLDKFKQTTNNPTPNTEPAYVVCIKGPQRDPPTDLTGQIFFKIDDDFEKEYNYTVFRVDGFSCQTTIFNTPFTTTPPHSNQWSYFGIIGSLNHINEVINSKLKICNYKETGMLYEFNIKAVELDIRKLRGEKIFHRQGSHLQTSSLLITHPPVALGANMYGADATWNNIVTRRLKFDIRNQEDGHHLTGAYFSLIQGFHTGCPEGISPKIDLSKAAFFTRS